MKNFDSIFLVLKQNYSFIPVVAKLSGLKHPNAFKILITAMISARTKDEVTELASSRLFELGNSATDFVDFSVTKIQKAIFPVGFYKTKAKNIKLISEQIIKKFNKNVPNNLDDLMSLPGVGLKTASLTLNEAFGNDSEICVDTHVHRISNRLGLIKTSTPEESAEALKKVLPRKYWGGISHLMVSYGKTICKPIGPKCKGCSLNKICEFGLNIKTKIKKA